MNEQKAPAFLTHGTHFRSRMIAFSADESRYPPLASQFSSMICRGCPPGGGVLP